MLVSVLCAFGPRGEASLKTQEARREGSRQRVVTCEKKPIGILVLLCGIAFPRAEIDCTDFRAGKRRDVGERSGKTHSRGQTRWTNRGKEVPSEGVAQRRYQRQRPSCTFPAHKRCNMLVRMSALECSFLRPLVTQEKVWHFIMGRIPTLNLRPNPTIVEPTAPIFDLEGSALSLPLKVTVNPG